MGNAARSLIYSEPENAGTRRSGATHAHIFTVEIDITDVEVKSRRHAGVVVSIQLKGPCLPENRTVHRRTWTEDGPKILVVDHALLEKILGFINDVFKFLVE